MSPYFESYLTVGAFAALGAVLVLVMLGVAAVLRPSKPTKTKQMTYECGVDPVGSRSLPGRARAQAADGTTDGSHPSTMLPGAQAPCRRVRRSAGITA